MYLFCDVAADVRLDTLRVLPDAGLVALPVNLVPMRGMPRFAKLRHVPLHDVAVDAKHVPPRVAAVVGHVSSFLRLSY